MTSTQTKRGIEITRPVPITRHAIDLHINIQSLLLYSLPSHMLTDFEMGVATEIVLDKMNMIGKMMRSGKNFLTYLILRKLIGLTPISTLTLIHAAKKLLVRSLFYSSDSVSRLVSYPYHTTFSQVVSGNPFPHNPSGSRKWLLVPQAHHHHHPLVILLMALILQRLPPAPDGYRIGSPLLQILHSRAGSAASSRTKTLKTHEFRSAITLGQNLLI